MKKKITILLLAFTILLSSISNAQCDAPTGLTVSYNNNVTTFSWDTVATSTRYIIEIDWAGGTWDQGEDIATSNSYSITGLMQGGNFQWRVKADCNGVFSAYTTALYNSACLIPFNLTTTNITNNAATLNWEQFTTVNNINTGFSISYRLANTTNAWTQLTNIYNNPTATFFNLTGLTANTAYEWRVRRVCSFSNSNYVYSQFTTGPVPVSYCTPSGINLTNCNGCSNANWIRFFKLGTINRTSVSEPGGYSNVPMSTNLVIGSSNNAGQIAAGFSNSVSNSRFMIWIDYNRNGSFSDAGERMILNNGAASISGTTIKNFSINIPNTATAGTTRMRVFHIRNSGNVSNPCLTNYLGETEDYTVNLVAATNSNGGSFNLLVSENSISNNAISVGPNPSKGLYTIRIDDFKNVAFIEVLNTTGATLSKINSITNATTNINIVKEKAGLYLLKIVMKSGEQKIVKVVKL